MNKLTNFVKTLSELKKFTDLPVQNDRDRAGIIQAFEFTFEQSWKAIQKIAADQGVEIANPKNAFSYAMQNKWINQNDEKKWLNLLKDRNLTTHTYNQDLAQVVLERIQNDYIPMFNGLHESLKNQV